MCASANDWCIWFLFLIFSYDFNKEKLVVVKDV